MNFLNIAPAPAAPQTTARDPAGAVASASGSVGKAFELPREPSKQASLDEPAAGATELEVSSLASGAHEDKASPTPSSSDLTELPAIPEAIAEALPSREEAVAEVDSRFPRLRAGDKLALRAAPAVGELLPFFSASQGAPHGVAMAGAEADPELALATDDTTDADEPAAAETVLGSNPTVLLEGLPDATRASPPPLAPAKPRVDDASLSTGATAEGAVASAAPQQASDPGFELLDAPGPHEALPHAPVDGGAALSAGPAGAQAFGTAAVARPALSSNATTSEASASPAPPPSSALPPAATDSSAGAGSAAQRATSAQTVTPSADAENAEATDDSPSLDGADASGASRFEATSPDAKKNRGRRHAATVGSASDESAGTADARTAGARSPRGRERELADDEAHRAIPLTPSPTPGIPAPEAPLPFTQSLNRATQDLAATSGASSPTSGAEAAPPPARDAESPAASAPRTLDLRSQAWREHLLESARIRLPAFGAPGNLQTVTLQLHPRLMGALTVTLALTASGGVQMKLGAQNDRARRFFHGEAPAIAASLARGGLNVSSIEILAPQHDTALA